MADGHGPVRGPIDPTTPGSALGHKEHPLWAVGYTLAPINTDVHMAAATTGRGPGCAGIQNCPGASPLQGLPVLRFAHILTLPPSILTQGHVPSLDLVLETQAEFWLKTRVPGESGFCFHAAP